MNRPDPSRPGDAAPADHRIRAELAGTDDGSSPFVAAVRATSMPMVITDARQRDNPIVFANEAFCRLTGYDRSEVLGRNCRFLQGPETDPTIIEQIRAALSAGRPISVDLRNHRKDGGTFWNRLHISPVRDAAGELTFFVGSQVDITRERERLLALERRNESLSAKLNDSVHEHHANEEALSFTLEAGRLGAWSLDLRSYGLTTSTICRAALGRKPDAPLTYADFLESVYPDDRQAVEQAIASCATTAPDIDMEFRALHPGGRVGHVAMQGRVSHVVAGRPMRVSGIMLDISERVRADRMRQGLFELGDAFRDLDDIGQISFIAGQVLGQALSVDRAGYGTVDPVAETITIERDWNAPGVRSLAGTLRFRDYGSYIEDLVRGEVVAFQDAEADPRTSATAEALKAITARAVVNMPVVEHGQTVALFYLNHGEVREWHEDELAFLRDVAARTRIAVERRRAELALREANERLIFLDGLSRAVASAADGEAVMAIMSRMTGEHMRVSICAYADMDDDADHFTIRGDWAAPGSSSIVGRYRLSDFGQLAVRELSAGRPLVVHDNRTQLPAEAAKTFQDIGIGATICMPLVKKGALTALMAIHDTGPRQWTGEELSLIREITERCWVHIERVQSSVQLRELNDTLELRIKERTQQLMRTEEALRQAQKMEAVGQLTGGLAHDFNNLLAGISGSLEMIQSRIAQGRFDTLERFSIAAMGAVRRAASLTHRLLAFSRRQTLDPKPVNLNRLVFGLEELIRRTIGPQIQLEIVEAGGIWATYVDVNQLENSLLNLCINARDAMPNGGRLTIETANKWFDQRAAAEQDMEPGQYVSLCVTDTGTGMAPDVISKAFDPFFTTKPLGEGTGLGLSMVYGFARQSGGQVRIYSELGRGTTLCIYLPRHDGLSADEEPLEAGTDALPLSDGEVVLVIDDEPSVRMLIAEILMETGYTVIEAADGPSGLKILQSNSRIDLLITDVGLPGGLNGRQVADAARMTRPGLKILFITGYAENAVVGNGHLDRNMSIVTKPFEMDVLATKIRDMLIRED